MKKQTAFMILSIMILLVLQGFLLNGIVKVTPSSMGDWEIDNFPDNGNINFMAPGKGPHEPRGLEFNPTNPDPESTNIRIRLSGYNNTPLNEITKLKYRTFTKNNNKFVPFVVLQVALTATQNAKIVFEPRLQQGPKVKKDIWQDWDLLAGRWWLNDGAPEEDPDHNPTYYTIKELLVKYPDAKLLDSNNPGFKGVSIRLSAGGHYPEWINSKTYADNFTIGTSGQPTEYQFEK